MTNEQHGYYNRGKFFRDPFCKMTIEDESDFIGYVYNGNIYHYCSCHCLAKFEKHPEIYSAEDEGARYHGHCL